MIAFIRQFWRFWTCCYWSEHSTIYHWKTGEHCWRCKRCNTIWMKLP